LSASGTAGGESGKAGGEVSANGKDVSEGGTYGEGLQVGVEVSTGASELKSLANEVIDAAATDVRNTVDTLKNASNGCIVNCGASASH
jgi:hypothetical protein